jgi:hypothetical protein
MVCTSIPPDWELARSSSAGRECVQPLTHALDDAQTGGLEPVETVELHDELLNIIARI